MKDMDQQTRQNIGCGWEPRTKLVQIRPWTPANMDPSWKGEHEVCPGYTTNLPEVIEIARARVHWKEGGGLSDFCDELPSEALRQGVEILEGASNECQAWAMEHPQKDGR